MTKRRKTHKKRHTTHARKHHKKHGLLGSVGAMGGGTVNRVLGVAGGAIIASFLGKTIEDKFPTVGKTVLGAGKIAVGLFAPNFVKNEPLVEHAGDGFIAQGALDLLHGLHLLNGPELPVTIAGPEQGGLGYDLPVTIAGPEQGGLGYDSYSHESLDGEMDGWADNPGGFGGTDVY